MNSPPLIFCLGLWVNRQSEQVAGRLSRKLLFYAQRINTGSEDVDFNYGQPV
jgi:hypothetical protein